MSTTTKIESNPLNFSRLEIKSIDKCSQMTFGMLKGYSNPVGVNVLDLLH